MTEPVPDSDPTTTEAIRELVIAQDKAPDPAPMALDTFASLLAEYKECQNNAEFWTNRRDKIKAKLVALLGTATEGTIDGETAVIFRPVDRFNGTEFKKKYPDLWRVYQRVVERSELDVDLLKRARPDLYAQFQTRPLLVPWEAPGS